MFNYRSLDDLKIAIASIYQHFAHVDVIVGVPRSGLTPSCLLSLYLNKPLSTPELISEGKFLSTGSRLSDSKELALPVHELRLLVVDDSILGGSQLLKTKELLSHCEAKKIEYYCVYATSSTQHLVDYFSEIVENPRLFEWNITNHYFLNNACVDIDGVLCADPSIKQNDDGPKYRQFLLNAPLLIKPKFNIHSLVTSRLEKYRGETVQWLENNEIEYTNLIMSSFKTADERKKANSHGELKAEAYLNSDNILFIESDIDQARKIFEITKKPVFCVDKRVYFDELSKADIKEKIQVNAFRKRSVLYKTISPIMRKVLERL